MSGYYRSACPRIVRMLYQIGKNNHLQCNCVKYIDENVVDEVTEVGMYGLIWTKRNADFPTGELKIGSL